MSLDDIAPVVIDLTVAEDCLAFEREVFDGIGRGIARLDHKMPLVVESVAMLRERVLAALRLYVRDNCHRRHDLDPMRAEQLAAELLEGAGL